MRVQCKNRVTPFWGKFYVALFHTQNSPVYWLKNGVARVITLRSNSENGAILWCDLNEFLDVFPLFPPAQSLFKGSHITFHWISNCVIFGGHQFIFF
jgi:hypothetical protein